MRKNIDFLDCLQSGLNILWVQYFIFVTQKEFLHNCMPSFRLSIILIENFFKILNWTKFVPISEPEQKC